jgi:hypothetical protein
MVKVLRSALSARAELLLEILALRHQLGVLARSNRRFRPADRLLWVCLRRWWPQWKEALELVQPAAVARWEREGFLRWWPFRPRRRPGRPRIDVQLRGLIRRMAMDNGLWGAPRIDGELLKLGISVSERTVSRYLPNRRKARSQSWRTFFANEFGQLAFALTVTSSDAPCVHNVLTPRVCRFARLRIHSTGDRSHCRAVHVRPLASLASPRSTRQAACPGSRAPPHNRLSHCKESGSRAPSKSAETRADGGVFSSGDSISNNGLASDLTRFDPRTPSLSAVLRNHVVNIAFCRSVFICRRSSRRSVVLGVVGISATHKYLRSTGCPSVLNIRKQDSTLVP